MTSVVTPPLQIDTNGLGQLVHALVDRGYRVIAPTLGDTAVVLAEIASADELPFGWGVDVAPGSYRLRARVDRAAFGHASGPQSWKRFVHPSRQLLWSSREDAPRDVPSYAFVGVRPCDLTALAALDEVFAGDSYARPAFTVAVNCTEPGGLCFCASMGTGPSVRGRYDLALTELADADGCVYVVDVGSAQGAAVLADVTHVEAPDEMLARARQAVAGAAGRMGRRMPDVDLREVVAGARGSDHWGVVAARCLTCGNCTMVCPTCFCTTVEDVTDLAGEHAERWARWASCFEPDFAYVHGSGDLRPSTGSRYRQWLSHKLGTWHDQFGRSGCVGCGRCIAWCPTGIDITEEMHVLAAGAGVPMDVPVHVREGGRRG